MRSKVFGHIQKMPIAFFSRTQTGALDHPAQQRRDRRAAGVHRHALLRRVNIISVTLVLIVMFFLSWQITLISLIILPIFVFPATRVGRRLSVITRESYGLNAEMNTTMTERFNVSGALLVKLFGRPGEELGSFEKKAGRVRDIGVTQAMYARCLHRRAHADRIARHRGRLRVGRRAGRRRDAHSRDGRRARRLSRPASTGR